MQTHQRLSWSIVLAALLVGTVACSGSDNSGIDSLMPVKKLDYVVSTQWLAEHLDDPDLVVIDCEVTLVFDEEGGMSSKSGRENYSKGHIPGAGFADLLNELADSESPFQFAVPSHEQFRQVMGNLGVGNQSRVVLYDSSSGSWAARVWWMLRWVGIDNVAILDGGQKAWIADGRPLSTDVVARKKGSITTPLRPELIATRDDVSDAINSESVTLIDALSKEHYSGQMSMYDRPGHIKGAINVSVFDLSDESGFFKTESELEGLFEGELDDRTITYCGGGIAASASAFAMTRLGYTDVAVYTNSLQEWAADPANPMEVSKPE